MEKKKLPIGVSDFRELIGGGYYYVDKTNFIRDIVDGGTKVTLITRPRRFGKTLNMQMLKEFFDIEKDSKELFKGLDIEKSRHMDEMNSYPVIFLSFRDCKGDKAMMISLMKEEILEEYDRFEFIKENLNISKKLKLDAIVDELRNHREDNLNIINTSIKFLCNIVTEHYEKSVMLFIDEYDTPMVNAYTEGYYEELRSFFTVLYASALKDNEYLKQGVLTGIQRIAKENIFSGLNNIDVITVKNKEYSKYFGLTEEETRTLLNYYEIEFNDEVKAMYDGYNFGGTEVYNPWSIIKYAKSGELMPYWINTSSNIMIRQCIMEGKEDFKKKFERLIEEGVVDVTLKIETSFFELNETATLWGLMLNAGYITLAQINTGYDICKIKIPNNEVKMEFRTIVAQYTNINEDYLKEMFHYLLVDKDIEAFKEAYQSIILNCTSYYDAKENAYHMLFLGMCIYLNGYYEVKSNMESGEGRADIILKAKVKGYTNVVIEFKQGEDTVNLAKEALSQIHEKKYYEGLYGEVLLMGVAHNKKNCVIETESYI